MGSFSYYKIIKEAYLRYEMFLASINFEKLFAYMRCLREG